MGGRGTRKPRAGVLPQPLPSPSADNGGAEPETRSTPKGLKQAGGRRGSLPEAPLLPKTGGRKWIGWAWKWPAPPLFLERPPRTPALGLGTVGQEPRRGHDGALRRSGEGGRPGLGARGGSQETAGAAQGLTSLSTRGSRPAPGQANWAHFRRCRPPRPGIET